MHGASERCDKERKHYEHLEEITGKGDVALGEGFERQDEEQICSVRRSLA